jgi:tetratricopeptide (TPR) repeat protein
MIIARISGRIQKREEEAAMFEALYPWLRTPIVLIPLIGLVGLVVIVLIAGFHHLYFLVLPQRAIKNHLRTDPERLRRYLERVVATPSLIGPSSSLVARGALVGIYLPQGRHAEAAAHCRAMLASLATARRVGDFPALEADTRRRLSDCLDALGQKDEAEEERRLAAACVARAPEDTLRHLTKGTLLEREHRYAEASAAFEQALSVTPESNRTVRIECMTHLLLACFNAGRPAECLKWAEESIAAGAEGRYLRSAHRMAGLACGNLGRLEESEDHVRRAYDVAASLGDTPEMGQILGSLADIQRKRGKLAEADEACNKAAAVDPKAVRMAIAVQSQILREWGRFDDALELLGRHDEATNFVIPAHERRIRAVRALDMSRIEAECGRTDLAWGHIEEARSELAKDAKLGLKCEGAASWVLAARGLAELSRQVAGLAEARLSEFERDPSTCRGVLYDLGMAAFTRGDHENGEDCWNRYLHLSPDPVYRPTALYFRGECRRHRGNSADAEADFRQAVAMDIDTHYSRLAGARLAEMSLA